MSTLRSLRSHRPELAWLITIPLAALAVALGSTLIGDGAFPADRIPLAMLFLGLFIFAQATVLQFEVRRHGATTYLTELPLLLALFYLPPLMVVLARIISLVTVQMWQRLSPVKLAFNVSMITLSSVVAGMIVTAQPPVGVGPRTWLVLGGAVGASAGISFVAVVGVITLVQGLPPARTLLRNSISVATVAAVNIAVGLVVLLVLEAQPWSALLLVGLGAILVLVYRSYAQFIGQHRTLSELYDLSRAMGDASRDGTLLDVLLMRVRELLQADRATLWLPAHGRYQEVLLSARVDAPGLLDDSNTPIAVRERAVSSAVTVAVGPRMGDQHLRTAIRDAGVKDCIVVPLRSGSAVIGTLEVTGRLGDVAQFGEADVRLLETLGAQVAVAVENTRLVDRLRFDAYHDALTGLPNRRRLLALLEEAVKVRAPGEVVAVLQLDIDGLRDVNSSLGHEAGDQMIREVATRLREVTPAAALVGRTGSDEFLVTLRLPDAAAAVDLGGRLRLALQEPMEIDAITLDVDVAVGVAVHPDHGTEAEVLIKRADLAAEAAKPLAPPVQLFSISLESRSSHRLGLAGDFRRALEAGEVEVYFQPKVSLPDRRVVGVECLARWEHAAHGYVAPADFIAVAEHTGQLGRLTEVVLREGLHRARQWRDAGRSLPISVNLSARSLIDPTLPPHVNGLLEEYGVPASLLTLEIAEHGMVGDRDRILATLNRLSEMDVRLAVDDFGTGSSSLSYLRRLPVHEVKIDRSFIQGMATDPDDLAIVRAVVDLARHFGLVAVAEGVESELTVSRLEEVGCDVGQGFLFSRPLPFEKLQAWLSLQTEPAPGDPFRLSPTPSPAGVPPGGTAPVTASPVAGATMGGEPPADGPRLRAVP